MSESESPVTLAVTSRYFVRFITTKRSAIAIYEISPRVHVFFEQHSIRISIGKKKKRTDCKNNSTGELMCKAQDQEMKEGNHRLLGTFQYTVENVSRMEGSQLSPAFYIRNLPWKILVMPRSRETQEGHRKSLGFFLQCNAESESTSWGCCAIAQLSLLSSIEGQPSFSKAICHWFDSEENDWGFSHFMTWQDVLDPVRGYIKDDSITLEVSVRTISHCMVEQCGMNKNKMRHIPDFIDR